MSAPPEDKLRIAVEGCGHGTLDAIYAAVERDCEDKGWDGVDLLIIGGDFQATRNQHDLNVTAMPVKYRDMVDFHQYYSGAKIAPCLTIFIGGNHEASNHLFELYYGGWVAPNIYYLGAANVLRLGNLRIAGLSGIWKGYDYRKPHYERLPYNQEDLHSIFHVRELDVRKLLAMRSQVDIGLSHDWPQTVEWSGDYHWLFKRKDRFQADAENMKLGSTAAKLVLDRLRPPHWFSAHLHIRYTANYDHENPKGIQTRGGYPIPPPEHKQKISAWQGFHDQARVNDAAETQKALEEQRGRQEAVASTGIRSGPGYNFDETFKKVNTTNLSRSIDTIERKENEPPAQTNLPQLDGSCASRPLKRAREPDSPQQNDGTALRSPRFNALGTAAPRDTALGKETAEFSPPKQRNTAVPVASNPDQLDIDLSDDDEPVVPRRRSGSPFPTLTQPVQERKSEQSEDGGVSLNPEATVFQTPKQGEPMARQSSNSSKSSLDPSAQIFKPQSNKAESGQYSSDVVNPEAPEFQPGTNGSHLKPEEDMKVKPDDIPDDIRAELEGLSKTFAAPVQVEVSPELPFPEEITNKKTEFLALDKCLPGRHFLELLEVESTSAPGEPIQRPVKLHYDPEWLAILRVFAPELILGGGKQDPVPPHRGDTYYRDQILEQRKWVYENIVSRDLLQVPDNFEITAPTYDPSLQVEEKDMPREVTNNQTSQFCEMIGIENPFDIPEEERDARVEAGPRAESQWRGRGGQFGGGRGNWNSGRGGRGGRGGGRGRGRGRGARGRW
ncbi:uncharacterized protein HMPREF1541_03646 [Cyphellophora europaea CBS 101466]|uniref:Lariat debranching enzyme C-terminal domain-containing protein n=1 Tax=Cyphellophora europaea (strain CBS 101466) TaxID=1220924 RepID=W2RZE7_CYPE1|nr:uncharacterized protein HMPREF1541_03646 [Cyphellophora europaea CBS 101466]ETN41710.1 hypothetical protein HMPREF1541_03646 [Cyphellophora europaea CBS 101466]